MVAHALDAKSIPFSFIASAGSLLPRRLHKLEQRSLAGNEEAIVSSCSMFLLTLTAISSLLVQSAVSDDCSPHTSLSGQSAFLMAFISMSVLINPCTITLIGLAGRASLEFPDTLTAIVELRRAAHFSVVSGNVTCPDASLSAYMGGAVGYLAASALVVLSMTGFIGAVGEEAGAAVLAAWFAVFPVAACDDGARRLALTWLYGLAGAAALSAARARFTYSDVERRRL